MWPLIRNKRIPYVFTEPAKGQRRAFVTYNNDTHHGRNRSHVIEYGIPQQINTQNKLSVSNKNTSLPRSKKYRGQMNYAEFALYALEP
jgi:hypothetical protein